MKKVIALGAFFALMAGVAPVFAQSNGTHGNGAGQQYAMSSQEVQQVLKFASAEFRRQGLNYPYEFLKEKYGACECVIECTRPGLYKVSLGGNIAIVIMEDI